MADPVFLFSVELCLVYARRRLLIVYVFEVVDLVNNWMRNGCVMGYMYANTMR